MPSCPTPGGRSATSCSRRPASMPGRCRHSSRARRCTRWRTSRGAAFRGTSRACCPTGAARGSRARRGRRRRSSPRSSARAACATPGRPSCASARSWRASAAWSSRRDVRDDAARSRRPRLGPWVEPPGHPRGARAAGVPARFVNPKDFPDREAYDLALVRELQARGVGLVCLAGFMRILTSGFVRAYAGRILNVHPSLLPAFPGLAAQREALEYGVKVAGATVHFIDEGVDTGPVVLQSSVPVHPDDTEESLSARILAEEQRLYPDAIRLFAEGRLVIAGRKVTIR